jgi:IS5 family transposase
MQRFIENAKTRLASEPVLRIAELIDWQSVENTMQAEYWRDFFRKGGRVPYDHRAMFRALLLSRWHGLSYPKLERALRVRLDFLIFCGFDAGGKLPDACTLNRFQARLSADGMFDAMVAEVERQLHDNGLELRATLGALSDLKLVKMHS